jgi:hypothetical protein
MNNMLKLNLYSRDAVLHDNIKMNRVEIRWGGVDWICVVQAGEKRRALVNAVMNFRVP